VPPEDPTQPAPPANYSALISKSLKGFKDFAHFTNVQVSGPRWVDAVTGWSWLVCARYDDQQGQRFYAFFIVNNSIVNARYDVNTDRCAVQHYVPLDVATGTIASPSTLQQPIY
jgi:hypothetical protein